MYGNSHAVAEGVLVQARCCRGTRTRNQYARFTHGSLQDAARWGIDPKTGVADACDLHVSSSQWSSHP